MKRSSSQHLQSSRRENTRSSFDGFDASSSLESNHVLYTVALIENRAREVGIAAFANGSMHFELRQFCDSNLYTNCLTVLAILPPAEILLSSSSAGGSLDLVLQKTAFLGDVKRTFVPRKLFNEDRGWTLINELGSEPLPGSSGVASETHKYLAFAAFGALIDQMSVIYPRKSLRIHFQVPQDTLSMDVHTISQLELLPTRDSPVLNPLNPAVSLLGLFSRMASTPVGRKFLRRTILEPPSDNSTTTLRLDAVDSLLGSEDAYFAATKALAGFPDVERTIYTILQRFANSSDVLQLNAMETEACNRLNLANIRLILELKSALCSLRGVSEGLKLALKKAVNPAKQSVAPGRSLTGTGSVQTNNAGFSGTRNQRTGSVQLLNSSICNNTKDPSVLLTAIVNTIDDPCLTEIFAEIDQLISEDDGIEELLAQSANHDSRGNMPLSDCRNRELNRSERAKLSSAYALKKGINPLLDVARQVLLEIVSDIEGLSNTLQVDMKGLMPSLALTFSVGRGYHLKCRAEDWREFLRTKRDGNLAGSIEFIEVSSKRNIQYFNLESIAALNLRYQRSLSEIWLLSSQMIDATLSSILEHRRILALYRMCDAVALADCLLSFVKLISLNDGYVRPRVSTFPLIALKQARNVLLEYCVSQGAMFSPNADADTQNDPNNAARQRVSCVPNDTYLNSNSCRVALISGENMSGKTTYIKGVALVCIMAHIGCYVPAELAFIPLLRSISCRSGFEDSLHSNQSSFSKEVSEMAGIINKVRENGVESSTALRSMQAERQDSGRNRLIGRLVREDTRPSLVLVDEFGRGTSTLEGFSLAWSIVEALAEQPRVLALFTTHFSNLRLMPSVNCYVKALHMESRSGPAPNVQMSMQPSSFCYILSEGACEDFGYGIRVAATQGIPRDLIEDASRILDSLSSTLESGGYKLIVKECAARPPLNASDRDSGNGMELDHLASSSEHRNLVELYETLSSRVHSLWLVRTVLVAQRNFDPQQIKAHLEQLRDEIVTSFPFFRDMQLQDP